MLVPRVDADGNELGGVPTVQRRCAARYVPRLEHHRRSGRGRYDGRPFHAGQVCNYVGGMVPFAKTKAQRIAAGDPRLSLEERYKTHAGYVAAVKGRPKTRPAAATCERRLASGIHGREVHDRRSRRVSPTTGRSLVNQAMASNVCNQPGDGGKCNPSAP